MANGPAPYTPLLLLFLVVAALAVPWYASCEAPLEEIGSQLKMTLVLSPLFILAAMKVMSSLGITVGPFSFFPSVGPTSIHRAGGSPWGIALLLVFVITMISYKSTIEEYLHPFLFLRS